MRPTGEHMDLILTKTMAGLVPADQPTADYLQKVKLGAVIRGEFKKVRNPAFHRKGFALLSMAYDWWEPGEINSKYGTPERNFDRFRKDLTILAGFFHVEIRVDGTTRIEADSLSFGSMDDETFERVFNELINVVLKTIVPHMKKEELDAAVQRVLDFG